LSRPGLQCAKAGFLESLFGGVQIPEVAKEGRNGLRPSPGQRDIDVRGIVHLGSRTIGYPHGRHPTNLFS
jgi:hypothetical protein